MYNCRDLYKVIDRSIEPITLSHPAPIVLKEDLGMHSLFRYWRLNGSLLNKSETVKDLSKTQRIF